jgi:hypothetical protein
MYLVELWVTPKGLITDKEPDDAVEATLSWKDKTISLTLIPRLDRPTIVTPHGETLVFVRDLPSSASANLREKTARTLKENENDGAGEAVEEETEKKERESEDSGEFKLF